MTKQFKHPKLWRIARPAKDDDIRVKELIIWKYDLFIKEWSYDLVNNHRMSAETLLALWETLLALWFEEVKNNHFWNWMMDCKLFKPKWRLIETQNKITSEERLDNCSIEETNWAFFQTEEQAKQFDKMMMTVWKIWKWKKENDDQINCKYYLTYHKVDCVFKVWHDYDLVENFFLPSFSSKEKVDQLISDLWEEELNNLLCWIQ